MLCSRSSFFPFFSAVYVLFTYLNANIFYNSIYLYIFSGVRCKFRYLQTSQQQYYNMWVYLVIVPSCNKVLNSSSYIPLPSTESFLYSLKGELIDTTLFFRSSAFPCLEHKSKTFQTTQVGKSAVCHNSLLHYFGVTALCYFSFLVLFVCSISPILFKLLIWNITDKNQGFFPVFWEVGI